MIPKVLTIAGSDCSGGAGIQADVKTITVLGGYAMSVITALTAQNTTGVRGVLPVPRDFVGQQMDCVFSDIVPDAVKVGMVSDRQIIEEIAEKLRQYGAKNVVVDPVMVSTSGSRLLEDHAVESLISNLFPMAVLITPNIPEAEVLSGMRISGKEDMEAAGKRILRETGANVLIKSGHLPDCADDLLCMQGDVLWVSGEKIKNPNTHGTGCTLSSAIAVGLAGGKTIAESIWNAKGYLSRLLRQKFDLGKGSGPLWHNFRI